MDFFGDKLHWIPQSSSLGRKVDKVWSIWAVEVLIFAFSLFRGYLRTPRSSVEEGIVQYSSTAWGHGFGPISVSDGLEQAVWALLRKGRQQQAVSLYWLLEEPVQFGSLLDCPVWGRTTLSRQLHTAQVFFSEVGVRAGWTSAG